MELKVKSEKLKVILGAVSLLIALPLLGFSCGNGDKTKERKTAVTEPEASLSQDTDADQESDIQEPTEDQPQESKIPDGWKTYKSDRLNLSFAYPPDWYVLEDERLGILLNTVPFPQPLPPDILGVPMVIGMGYDDEQQHEKKLRDRDTQLVTEKIFINENQWIQYSSAGSVSEYDEPGIEYRSQRDTDFLQVGVNTNANQVIIQAILETMTF